MRGMASITERGNGGGSWSEGQSSCSAWPFVQVILERSKPLGARRSVAALMNGWRRNPRFEREVKFAPYFFAGDPMRLTLFVLIDCFY